MINVEKRKAVWALHQEGMSARKIGQALNINRKTVRQIIKQKGEIPQSNRRDKIQIDEDLLREVFKRCDGWGERIHEILTKEYRLSIGYSTLMTLIRELDLKNKNKKRADQKLDLPGEEFQHDTSPYIIEIGGQKTRVQASLIYYRYSKVRYLKFYRSFTRFQMKNIFYEALNYFEYVPKTCIIDNTNLAVLHGTGKNAIMVPEMNSFAKMFGFDWQAHEVGHSDRKAGCERGFWTAESKFFPGRTFISWKDLNDQALNWCQERSQRPVTKRKIIPADVYEHEMPYMKKILNGLPRPYKQHQRIVDQYGYIAFSANYYWIPRTVSGPVLILEYEKEIKIFKNRKEVADYPLPEPEEKNQRFTPRGISVANRPNNRKFASQEEERRLREMSDHVNEYITQALKHRNGSSKRHRFIKGVFSISRKVVRPIFDAAILRALKYQVYELETLNNICSLLIVTEDYTIPTPDIDYGFEHRDNYLEGEWSDEPDLNEFETNYSGGNNEDT